jgi:hypothetical protein
VPRPPGEHGVGENVVEDLVVRPRRAVLRGADDSLAGELVEDAPGLGFVHSGIPREIAGPVRDLRPRGRDQVVVHRSRSVLLLRRED